MLAVLLRDEAARGRDVPRGEPRALGHHRRLHGPVVGPALLPRRPLQRQPHQRDRDDAPLHRPRPAADLRERPGVRRVPQRESGVRAVAQLQPAVPVASGHGGQDPARLQPQDLRRGGVCAARQRDRLPGLRGRLCPHPNMHHSH